MQSREEYDEILDGDECLFSDADLGLTEQKLHSGISKIGDVTPTEDSKPIYLHNPKKDSQLEILYSPNHELKSFEEESAQQNETNSVTNFLVKIFDALKFLIDLLDDVIVALKHVITFIKEIFVEIAIGFIFGLIAAFEGVHANHEIEELKILAALKEIALKAIPDSNQQKIASCKTELAFIYKRISINRESLFWCTAAAGIGGTILITGGIGISILGAPLLPCFAMAALTRKYYNDYRDLKLQIELVESQIAEEKNEAKKAQLEEKLTELLTKRSFKRAEILAASIITFSLFLGGLAAIGAISFGSFGIIPLVVLGVGAAIGVGSKLKEMYDSKESRREKYIFIAQVISSPIWLPLGLAAALVAAPFYGIYKIGKYLNNALFKSTLQKPLLKDELIFGSESINHEIYEQQPITPSIVPSNVSIEEALKAELDEKHGPNKNSNTEKDFKDIPLKKETLIPTAEPSSPDKEEKSKEKDSPQSKVPREKSKASTEGMFSKKNHQKITYKGLTIPDDLENPLDKRDAPLLTTTVW